MTENIDSLTLDLGDRSYDILVGSNIIEKAGELIKTVISLNKVFIVTDKNIEKYHLKKLHDSLKKNSIEYVTIVMDPGEKTKSLSHLSFLLNSIFEHKPERKVTLIAFGGGVIGDLTGFAASILLRGVDFIQIPTTLLSQVDSSVGGKTGINNKYGKNLVGSFYQPKMVISDIAALATLPRRQFLSGYAEVVKYALINDVEFFSYLSDRVKLIKNQDYETLKYMVIKSCEAKAKIVAEDEREGGVRALLNLGHTFGHALEYAVNYSNKLFHGEAVAIGTIMAFAFSVRLGLCQEKDLLAVKEHFEAVGLPVTLKNIKHNFNAEELYMAMFQDKKVSSGKIVLILANSIGDCFVAKDIDVLELKNFIYDFVS